MLSFFTKATNNELGAHTPPTTLPTHPPTHPSQRQRQILENLELVAARLSCRKQRDGRRWVVSRAKRVAAESGSLVFRVASRLDGILYFFKVGWMMIRAWVFLDCFFSYFLSGRNSLLFFKVGWMMNERGSSSISFFFFCFCQTQRPQCVYSSLCR